MKLLDNKWLGNNRSGCLWNCLESLKWAVGTCLCKCFGVVWPKIKPGAITKLGDESTDPWLVIQPTSDTPPTLEPQIWWARVARITTRWWARFIVKWRAKGAMSHPLPPWVRPHRRRDCMCLPLLMPDRWMKSGENEEGTTKHTSIRLTVIHKELLKKLGWPALVQWGAKLRFVYWWRKAVCWVNARAQGVVGLIW